MLLTSVILVLQELLEASLIISVLLAYSVHQGISRRWIWPALALGIGCALVYAQQVNRVSEWFDYVGLEVVNASIQFVICLCLILFFLLRIGFKPRQQALNSNTRHWQLLMCLVVCLAIAREGFEILLYESGFIGNSNQPSVLLGSFLGAGIGISAGALIYYGLITMNRLWGQRLLLVLLAIFAGNMASQGTILLIQADWLPSGQPLWNSSGIIAEDSIIGQLLYALIGYEASPSPLQAGGYGLLCLLVLVLASFRWPDNATPKPDTAKTTP